MKLVNEALSLSVVRFYGSDAGLANIQSCDSTSGYFNELNIFRFSSPITIALRPYGMQSTVPDILSCRCLAIVC